MDVTVTITHDDDDDDDDDNKPKITEWVSSKIKDTSNK
eukprot:CAMPEP_0170828512 /NCGR_PEP_ID=MMETSP0733-20121128/47976_1 /TAXON_ID=186038 /ORGANISM="Fragilariopsis kerguelensis, Strain L26-C5" /LENGTH=37 /DNA_ID= /DNA_START= /DNA_END= /DNA_ORIENTATION=